MDMVLQWVLGVLATIITAIISGVLIPMVVKYLNAKTNNENVQAVITELGETVSTSVGYINKTIVDQAKEGGTWNDEAKSLALKEAVKNVIEGLSLTTKEIIGHDKLDLENIVIRRIEAELDARNATKEQWKLFGNN